jgi:hypothetical protein
MGIKKLLVGLRMLWGWLICHAGNLSDSLGPHFCREAKARHQSVGIEIPGESFVSHVLQVKRWWM